MKEKAIDALQYLKALEMKIDGDEKRHFRSNENV